MRNRNWTREELIVAFNLYCKIPFNKSSKTHPLILEVSPLLGRSGSAINMKIGNFGSLDPDLKSRHISGLGHRGHGEERIWEEFYRNMDSLAFESEQILARLRNENIESMIDISNLPEGKERERMVKQRVNQSFFRCAVLSSYINTCCISGTQNENVLESCHIVGWAEDNARRTDPHNGLCLSSLFHKAYDNMLLAITPDYKIIITDELMSTHQERPETVDYLKTLNGKSIIMPQRFFPDKELLDHHYQKFLNR